MSERPTVYLAGPMTGLTWKQALQWRIKAQMALEPSWRTLSPVKGQINDDDEMWDKVIEANYAESVPINLTASGYVTQDEFYIEQSDFLLVNLLGATSRSIGTIYEIGYARALNKKIVTVLERSSVHDHGFIRRRSHIFVPTVEEAIEYLKHISI